MRDIRIYVYARVLVPPNLYIRHTYIIRETSQRVKTDYVRERKRGAALLMLMGYISY